MKKYYLVLLMMVLLSSCKNDWGCHDNLESLGKYSGLIVAQKDGAFMNCNYETLYRVYVSDGTNVIPIWTSKYDSDSYSVGEKIK